MIASVSPRRTVVRVDRPVPGGDVGDGELADTRLVGAHGVTVERRQLQAAAREVLRRLEQQQRAIAEERAQDVVAVALGQRVAGEQALDRGAVGRDDARRHARQAERPGAAEARAVLGEEARAG